MKSILTVALAALLLAGLQAGALADDDGSFDHILAKGTFIVGFDAAFPPMSFLDEAGEPVGFDVELAGAACDMMNVTMVAEPVAWADMEQALTDGTIDCIWSGYAVTPARQERMTFSMSYMNSEQVFVVREGSGYAARADLAGATLGVQAASGSMDALDAATGFRAQLGGVTPYDTVLDLLAALENGEVDAALVDVAVTGYYMTTHEDSALRVLETPLAEQQFAVAVRKGEDDLKNAIDSALIDLAFNGIMEEISTDWFTADITTVAGQLAMAEED